MTEYAVAFIDVLGYSAATDDCLEGALGLLSDFSDILFMRFVDNNSHPIEEYSDDLKDAAEKSYVTSFEHFVPMSDSVFVFSKNPKLFIKQLSNFLFESFYVGASPFSVPASEGKDLRRVFTLAINEKSLHSLEITQNPLLFRGGIDFGLAGIVKMPAINNGNLEMADNVAGPAVVGAAKLEPKKRGPRIICSKQLTECIHDAQPWIGQSFDNVSEQELYWPIAALDNYMNAKEAAMNHLGKLMRCAINLWHFYDKPAVKMNYENLFKLLVASADRRFENQRSDIENCILRSADFVGYRTGMFLEMARQVLS